MQYSHEKFTEMRAINCIAFSYIKKQGNII